MKKASLIAGAALATLAFASGSAFAQPFADVPSDHWAYAAVDKLQRRGIVIGYPDGTYGGKRSMTRYEFAIAIARLLDTVQTNTTQPPIDLTPYALKTDLQNYALKSDLEGLARKEDVDTLRKMVEEFRAELVAIGVDIDAIKKRLDDLEKRVTAIENELKRVRIEGAVNVYVRGNNRFTSNTAFAPGGQTSSVRDANGFEVTGGANRKGTLTSDVRTFHDVDVDIKARLSDNATAFAKLNFGNYLPFIQSVGSFYGQMPGAASGARSDRSTANGVRTQFVNQSQENTVWNAYIDTGISTPILGRTGVQVGRIPLQLTPYTFRLIDTDYYFENEKTDSGNVPVDGLKAKFNLGPVGFTAFAAKTDPIKFLSNSGGNIVGDPGYGIYAGAGRTAYGNNASVLNNGTNSGLRAAFITKTALNTNGQLVPFLGGNVPFGSGVSPWTNGAIPIEQMGGVRVELSLNRVGNIGGTFIAMAGSGQGPTIAGEPTENDLAGQVLDDASFNRVYVYGADIKTNILFGIGVNGSYTKSDTAGERLGDRDQNTKIDGDNDAYDINLDKSFGKLYLQGGYRYIGPFFGAPGYWTRVGNYYNPVDIKGFYGNLRWDLSRRLALVGNAQVYEGTGDAVARGGLTEDDKINNYRAGLKFGATRKSNIDVGIEVLEYEVLNANLTGRVTPRQIWYNAGYGHTFNQNSSASFMYQFIDWDDKNSGFDPVNGDGGVATMQFRVKF